MNRRFVAFPLLALSLASHPLAAIAQTNQEVTDPDTILFASQEERRVAFQRVQDIAPARLIPAGKHTHELASAPRDLDGVTYEVDGKSYTVADYLASAASIGLIVVQDNAILMERYAPGNNAASRWISFSVSKSVSSMLIGAAIQDGFIKSVDEPVVNYVSRFRGTAYEKASIRDVLQMASGVRWNEDYEDPESDVAQAGGLNGVQLVNYLAKLPADARPGRKFNYNTGETNLVGEILRAAIGNNASTYLTHKIWQPFGMEYDAYWTLGEAGGGELGGCCINATLRDYARLGIFAMNQGVLADGTRVLPEGWMEESTTPSKGSEGYGYLWWLWGDGSYAALGIFGQSIYIDPAANLVIATHGNALHAAQGGDERHRDAVTQAIRKALTR